MVPSQNGLKKDEKLKTFVKPSIPGILPDDMPFNENSLNHHLDLKNMKLNDSELNKVNPEDHNGIKAPDDRQTG